MCMVEWFWRILRKSFSSSVSPFRLLNSVWVSGFDLCNYCKIVHNHVMLSLFLGVPTSNFQEGENWNLEQWRTVGMTFMLRCLHLFGMIGLPNSESFSSLYVNDYKIPIISTKGRQKQNNSKSNKLLICLRKIIIILIGCLKDEA